MAGLLNVGEMSALALHVMVELANQEKTDPEARISVLELAERLSASHHTLHKVAKRLVNAGLADSARGATGGLKLATGAGDSPILAVVEAVEGKLQANGCLFTDRVCPEGEPCAFHDLTVGLEQQVRDYFSHTKVRDLALTSQHAALPF